MVCNQVAHEKNITFFGKFGCRVGHCPAVVCLSGKGSRTGNGVVGGGVGRGGKKRGGRGLKPPKHDGHSRTDN